MKNLFVFIGCIYCCTVIGQSAPRTFIYGMSTSLEFPSMSINTSPEPQIQPLSPVTVERLKPGAGIGLFGRWPINASVAYQQEMLLSFTSNTITFREKDQELRSVDFQFNELELPCHFVFTNNRRADTPISGCITLGARLGANLYRNESADLTLLRERLGLDAGLGVEIRLKKLCIQPELMYSHAISNQHDPRNGRFDALAGRILRDRVTLRLLLWLKN